jgi:hypothetical protein
MYNLSSSVGKLFLTEWSYFELEIRVQESMYNLHTLRGAGRMFWTSSEQFMSNFWTSCEQVPNKF